MIPGNEPRDDFDDGGRHRHGFYQITPGVGKRLAFRRISGHGQQFIRKIRRSRTHNHPQRRRGRSEIIAWARMNDDRFAPIAGPS